jgi:cell division protein FtsB
MGKMCEDRGYLMSDDAKARILLTDGREVWRDVRVRYREVRTGRWIPKAEAEALMPVSLHPSHLILAQEVEAQSLRQRLMEVQAEIALDRDAGAKATSAARLVLNMLKDKDQAEQTGDEDTPWFVLGRQLAKEVLN